MNRTIEKRVRCMSSDPKLPKAFWAEAMCTAIDLINFSPSVLLYGDALESAWL